MTKQEAKEQKRKAKQLARLLGHRDFVFTNSICVPGDGIVALTVELSWNGKSYWASGAAKRNMVDKWNEEIGVEIATGRALLRIAYQILRGEEVDELLSIQEEVLEAIKNEYGNVTGVFFVKRGPGPRVMFQDMEEDELSEKFWKTVAEKEEEIRTVPGSAKYRGGEYGYGVIKPEYVPSGLEVIKEKEEADDRGDKAEGRPE